MYGKFSLIFAFHKTSNHQIKHAKHQIKNKQSQQKNLKNQTHRAKKNYATALLKKISQ